jgi:hypothetical protein
MELKIFGRRLTQLQINFVFLCSLASQEKKFTCQNTVGVNVEASARGERDRETEVVYGRASEPK